MAMSSNQHNTVVLRQTTLNHTGLQLASIVTRHCARDASLTHGSLRSALLRSISIPLAGPSMYGRAAGRIFFSGTKAQRSEPFRKKMMLAASPCDRANLSPAWRAPTDGVRA